MEQNSLPDTYYCDPKCKTCDIFDKKKCLTCTKKASLNTQNICNCNQTYYSSSAKPLICSKCLNGCKVCFNGMICTECYQGRIGNNCQCPIGYYDDYINLDCQVCPLGCEECNLNQCTKCISSKRKPELNCQCGQNQQVDPSSNECVCISGYMLLGDCYSNCPSGYFQDDLNKYCIQCDISCLECQGSASNCSVLNDCPSGFYKDPSDYICKNCQTDCSECLSSTFCTKCISSKFLFNNQCFSSCQNGYYKDTLTNQCSPCSIFCAICSDSTSKCSVCSQFAYKEVDTGFCISQCKLGQFQDESNKKCVTCHPNCSICIGPDEFQCLNCKQNLYLENGSCVVQCSKVSLNGICSNQCPQGYYTNPDKQCKKCSSLCLECIYKEDQCSKCITTAYYIKPHNQCVETCPEGFFANFSDKSCLKCQTGCVKCLNLAQCQQCEYPLVLNNSGNCVGSCLSTQYVHKNQCYDQCPTSSYNLQGTNKCQDCNIACLICIDDTSTCSKCSISGFKLNNQCYVKCPENYYNDDNRVCQPCNTTCNSCQGPTDQDCLTCKIGYFFYAGKCVGKCPSLIQDKQCVSSCSDSYYLEANINICKQCHPFCTSCIDSTPTCSTCSDLAYKLNTQCVNSCPNGFYGNIDTRNCEQCNSNCNTCFGGSDKQCLSCKDGQFLQNNECILQCKYLVYKGECLKQCPNKTYPDWKQKICSSCNILCSICQDDTNSCSECSSVAFRYNNKICLIECPEGTYPNLDRTCDSCHSSCIKCSGGQSNNCIQCKPELYLAINECVDKCPIGYYPKGGTNICIACDSNVITKGKKYDQCKKSITLKIEGVSGNWNKIKLEFSEAIILPLNDEKKLLEMVVIKIQDVSQFTIDIQKSSTSSYILTINTSQEFVEQKKFYLQFKDPTQIKSTNGSILSNDFSLGSQMELSDDDKLYTFLQPSIVLGNKEILSKSSENTVLFLSGILLPIQILASQIISTLMVNIAQVLNYWMYIDMFLPSNLEISLQMLKLFNLDFLPSIGDNEPVSSKISGQMDAKDKQFFGEQIVGQRARYRFEQRGKLTTSFMLNGMNKINIIIVAALINYLLKKFSKFRVLNKLQAQFDNFLIGFLASAFIPLVFGAFLQLNNVSEQSIENILSFLLALFVMGFITLYFILQVIESFGFYKYRRYIVFDEEFKKKQPLFLDLKLNENSNVVSFLFPHLLNFKDILIIFAIIVFYDYPQFIIGMLFLLQITQLYLNFKYIQYEKKGMKLVNILNSSLILMMVFFFATLYLLNVQMIQQKDNEKALLEKVTNIGWVIIAIFLFMISVNILYIIGQLFQKIKQFLQERKSQNDQNFIIKSNQLELEYNPREQFSQKLALKQFNQKQLQHPQISSILTNANLTQKDKNKCESDSNSGYESQVKIIDIFDFNTQPIKWVNNPLLKPEIKDDQL